MLSKTAFLCAVVLLAGAAWAAIPPLDVTGADEKAILEGATQDFVDAEIDRGIYPLLRNAIWWDTWDRTGAAVPDCAAIIKTPSEYRGQLFLVSGVIANEPKTIAPLATRGPWNVKTIDPKTGQIVEGTKILECDIHLDPPSNVVAVMLLVDAPPDWARLKGRHVDVVGRFYKVWRHEGTLNKAATEFPVFVGKTIYTPLPGAEGATDGTGMDAPSPGAMVRDNKWGIGLLLILVLSGLMVLILRKKFGGRESVATMAARERIEHERRMEQARREQTETGEPPLPKDPVLALEELERRRVAGMQRPPDA